MKSLAKTSYIALILTVMALSSTSCRPHTAGPDTEGASAALDSMLSRMFPADAPGAVAAVSLNDSIIYLRPFGLADMDSLRPVQSDTRFNICSISKQFSAIALLKLQEQGLLSLDEPVNRVFPEFQAPFYGQITLRHLMSHTSGLPDIRPRTPEEWEAYKVDSAQARYADVEDYMLHSSEPDALDMFRQVQAPVFTPGTAYEYQNPTFQLVYYIVERLTGTPFEQWMAENIFTPAGMTRTGYFSPTRPMTDAAHGYELRDTLWKECDYGEAPFFPTAADGGLYTTATDFLCWQKALYGDDIVSATSREQAHTPLIATDIPHTGYGLGFFIEDLPGRPRKIYHTGDNGGFFAYACAIPSQKVSYLIFATHQGWDRLATASRIDSILQEHRIINIPAQ